MYDLHVHSTASDGLLNPEELLVRAEEIGLKGLAITDHDTVHGIEEAYAFLTTNPLSLQFIPGIEMNTELDENEVHILGYFIDYHNSRLLHRLEEIREARWDRARKMVYRLKSMGLAISFEQVEKLAQGDLIGRPHVARALTEKGYVFSVKEAFDKFIGKGRPAYVPRYKFLPREAIELIKSAAIDLNYNLFIRIGNGIAFNYGDKQVFASSILFVYTIETEYLAVTDGNIVTGFINSLRVLYDSLFTTALQD
jgi:predicted metal-dependent phosphoesterase TrpH